MKLRTRFWLTVLGTALLIMVINIAASIAEVFIYSLFTPDHPQSFYEAHAQVSAPWVSGIVGGVLMYIFIRRYTRKNNSHQLLYAFALPTAYVLIDLAIILSFTKGLTGGFIIFILANIPKYAGALLAYYFAKPKSS